jgi:hypothetical protein
VLVLYYLKLYHQKIEDLDESNTSENIIDNDFLYNTDEIEEFSNENIKKEKNLTENNTKNIESCKILDDH